MDVLDERLWMVRLQGIANVGRSLVRMNSRETVDVFGVAVDLLSSLAFR